MNEHILYVLRWAALAIPGAWLLQQARKRIRNYYVAMMLSQAALGWVVYYLDRWILQ
jgi:hypothetical protein